MWVTITNDMILSAMTPAELEGLRRAEADPLDEIIAAVVDEVRGFVETSEQYEIGPEGTVPQRLVQCAKDRVRFELLQRLPSSALMTEDRRASNQRAVELLDKVAKGEWGLGEIETSSQGSSGPRVIGESTSQRTRSNFEGM